MVQNALLLPDGNTDSRSAYRATIINQNQEPHSDDGVKASKRLSIFPIIFYYGVLNTMRYKMFMYTTNLYDFYYILNYLHCIHPGKATVNEAVSGSESQIICKNS